MFLVVFVIGKCDRIFSRDLVLGLIARADRPWSESAQTVDRRCQLLRREPNATLIWLFGLIWRKAAGLLTAALRSGQRIKKTEKFFDGVSTGRGWRENIFSKCG